MNDESRLPLRVYLLAIGTFAIGTDGFVIAGVLGDIAKETDVSVAAAGQLVTIFAWVYAVSSPITAAAFARIPRRQMLYGALVVFTLGNVIAALSPNYVMLAVGRVVSAIGAAAYTPNASIAAASMAPAKVRGRSLAVVLGGLTIANIVGVPIGTYLGNRTDYHGVFWLVTGLGVVAMLSLLTLPAIPTPPPVSLRTRLGFLRTPGVATTLAVTLFGFIAGFTFYTYVGELSVDMLHTSTTTTTLIFLTFGVAGAIGNVLGGRLTDRWGAYQTAFASFGTFWIFLALAPWAFQSLPGAFAVMFCWGVLGWVMVTPQQHRLISLQPPAAPLLLSLNASAMYLGIGSGGLIGGAVIRYSEVRWVPLAAAAAGVVAFVLFLLTAKRPARASSAPTAPAPRPTPAADSAADRQPATAGAAEENAGS